MVMGKFSTRFFAYWGEYWDMSRKTLSFDVLREEEMLAIVDHVGEVADPVAQDNHTGFLGELQVDLDVAMAIDEIVDVGVVLYILLGIEYQMLAVFAHIGRLLAADPLQP